MSAFLFAWLVLAHVIADFPLQTNWIFKVRMEKSWGNLLHGSLFGIVVLIMLLGLYFGLTGMNFRARPDVRMWLVFAVIILWLSHVLIDTIKVWLTKKYGFEGFALFAADQGAHLAVVYAVCRWYGTLGPGDSAGNAATAFVLLFMGIVVSGSAGVILCTYVAKAMFSEVYLPVLNPFLKYSGMTERMAGTVFVFLALLFNPLWFLAVPLAYTPRWVMLRHFQNTGKDSRGLGRTGLATSFVTGILSALFFGFLALEFLR